MYSRVSEGDGVGTDPVFPLFCTRIPHPEFPSSLSRLSFSFRSRTSAENCYWPALFQTSYFIGPCNMHYLLFSGIGALLGHHPLYCFPSQSQTLFGAGAGRPKIWANTASLVTVKSFYLVKESVFWGKSRIPGIPFQTLKFSGKSRNQHPLTYWPHIKQCQVKLCITIGIKVNFVTKYAWKRMQLN